MIANLNRYFVLKLNVAGIKEREVDTYISNINNIFTNMEQKVLLIPVTDSQTSLTVIYQITDNNGNIEIKEVSL